MAQADIAAMTSAGRREQTLLLQAAELQRQIQDLQGEVAAEKELRRAAELVARQEQRAVAGLTRKLQLAALANRAATAAAMIAAGKTQA